MTYESDVKRFTILVKARTVGTVLGVAAAVHESITVGSAVTGAPGQPVDTSALLNSWQNVPDPDGLGATIGTNLNYAPVIEHNSRAAFDSAGRSAPDMPTGGAASRNLAFGVRGGQVGPSESGDRVTLRSAVGGFHSVKLTVNNADALQAAVVRELGGGR